MSDSRPQAEPSIEEILASIRRIISDDDDPNAQAAGAANEEVLDLTERVEEAPPMPEPEPMPAPAPAMAAPPMAAAAPLAAAGVAMAAAAAVHHQPRHYDDRLVSEPTAQQATGQFARLVDNAPDSTDDPLPIPHRSLESVVREMLRPMLKDWLDTHLPPIVERLVERELRRMSREAEGV